MKITKKTTIGMIYSALEIEHVLTLIDALEKQAEIEAFTYYLQRVFETAIRNEAVISTFGCDELLEILLKLKKPHIDIQKAWRKLAQLNDFNEWWDKIDADGSSNYKEELFVAKLAGNDIKDYSRQTGFVKINIKKINARKQKLKRVFDKELKKNGLRHCRLL